MSILEKYDLKAGKFIWPSGKRALTVDSTNPYSDNVVLTCLGSLDRGECIAFLRDMNECLENGNNGNAGFITDSIEYLYYGIDYQYPNVIVDNILTLPMEDMKEILEELIWLFD